ncbi:Exosome complex exonuclease RRP6 [Mycena chlorophos]|uniref:Exosome complex exonuclease RRP6 n=1 Tax=Mycena chlorophos TaxID=658473 RepID=A0A8H6TJV0_MYCCL|nr:Exosome complex exonuclease RRP6 [Mycena chlorophos]
MASGSGSNRLSSATFGEFNTAVQSAALNATRSAAGLPGDIKFHRSIDAGLADDLDAFSARVLSLTNNLLVLASTSDSSRRKGKGKLQTQDDVVDDFHSLVVDSMDQFLERTDMCLDEFQGKNKAPQVAINLDALRKANKPSNAPKGQLDAAVQHAANLAKPQLRFKQPIDNSNDAPWYPTLSHKFNAQVPLGHVFRDTEGDALIRHPYRYEIKHIAYPARMFVAADPIPPTPFETTAGTWVSTPEALEAMSNELQQAQEIAIDLEHNNYRSFAGIVCLMQISTRAKDWIVDTLALRAELARGALNEVFTDPSIVKVFHGAESDIVWLQQDFNLYIVNLFDTFHASKLLEFPRHGLANLLEMYCDFVPDKRYQLADWRIRPLPQDMLNYARSDTHFLLYIYDNLRNALLDRAMSKSRSPSPSGVASGVSGDWPLQQNLIRQALARSEETALRTYEKEVYDAERGVGPGGWDTLARKWNKGGLVATAELADGKETLQRAVYRCVHQWRDTVARREDESTRYILPNHFLFQLAEQPPADMAALLKTFSSVPQAVRRHAKELLDAIRACVQAQLAQPKEMKVVEAPTELAPPVAEMDLDRETKSTDAPNMWASNPFSSSLAGKSSLFGGTLRKETGSAKSRAAHSTLFGAKTRASKSSSGFQDVVARIHSALVVVPTLPEIAAPSKAVSEPAPVLEETSGMQVEIPFVPAAQRSTKPVTEVLDDSIVVVGQPRAKKRKRVKSEGADGEGSSSKPTKKASPQAQTDDPEPFDFSSVPNILDDAPKGDEDTRVKKKRKGKKDKGGEAKPMYGDFPAPPRAYREVKQGNQSRTFK